MRPSWLLAAGATAIAGFSIAGTTHQNIADRVNGDNPGSIAISYYQPAPEMGKLFSLVCAAGFAGCLWMSLKEDKPIQAIAQQTVQQGVFQPQVTTSALPQAMATPVSFHQQPIVVYDEDPDIDIKEINPPKQIHPKSETSNQFPNIFERIYNHHKRHILMPSETGGGKTTLLLGAMDWIWQHTNGNVEFFGSTAKQSPWGGLEHQKAGDNLPQVINLSPSDPSSIHDLISRLQWIQNRMVARQQERTRLEQQGQKANFKRIYIILDEWLQTLAIAKKCDRLANLNVSKEKDAVKSDTYGELIELVECFIQCGREDECCLWIFGQDHQVQNAKINTGYTKSFGIIVPARADSLLGLEDALTGRSPITTPTRGKEIFAKAEELVQHHQQSGIVYSNIVGHELLPVPYLPDIKRKRIFSQDNKVVQFPKAVGSIYEPEANLDDPWN